ncbi:GNAT family N-acetyltransferase [Sphingobacterium litopenaei]|uniref:GNAT family N-acetyltransferase n=1 Tax=Sphingobacterium litopenaei TaxID=2763500 RepID=A0ABR7YB60_9SPHI|nr:GNAT family N-acetyltransferase [Sphingobacterium litopenaei]MBD1428543.1 GNAT family N-acetyltransferase [Sphingobacterium litopenaei]
MDSAILIRKFKPEDSTALLQIIKNNTPEYFAVTEIEDYKTYLETEIQDYFVAVLEDKIIAGAGINYDREKQLAKISWDVVDIGFHKQGIGTLLLNHRLEIIATRKNIKSIIVRTSQHAYAFYEKNGFKLLERHKDYWAEGFDMYKMSYNKKLIEK